MKKNLLIFLVFSAWSCQKAPISDPLSLRPNLSEYFSLCVPADGGLKVGFDARKKMVSAKERPVASVQLDWISKGVQTGWKAELTDPIGRQILRLNYADQQIDVAGAVKENLPEISVSKEGFVQIEGYEIGFKASEIPCLLGFKLPVQWSLAVEKEKRSAEKENLLIRPDHRKIKLVFFTGKHKESKKSCALISWSRFLGLQQSRVMWCKYVKNGTNYSYLHGKDIGTLFWEDDGY